MLQDWSRPIAMVALMMLPVVLGLPVSYLIESSGIWKGAQTLFRLLILSSLYLPPLCLAGILAMPRGGNAVHVLADRAPAPVQLLTATIMPGVFAAAGKLILTLVTPVALRIAGAPGGMWVVFISMFLPVTPVSLFILLLPGVWCGWLARRISGVVWPAIPTGLIYGLLALHITLGLAPFEQRPLIKLYVAGLAAHVFVSVAGAVLSERWRYVEKK